MIKDKISAIYRLKFDNPDEALREVAEQIVAGDDDPLFRLMLATMIHPDRRPVGGRKFKLVSSGGRPPRARNRELEEFLELNIDIHGLKTEAVFNQASKEFGKSRSSVAAALKRARADRDEDFFCEYRKSVLQLSKNGNQDYQPAWSPEKS